MLKTLSNIKYGLTFLSLGIFIFFYKCVLSGFDLLPGDNIDSRYINYILEHFWQWFHQIPPHQNIWDMPCLYPAKNTLALSDTLFGLGILYIPIRFFTNPYNAFLITILIMCILNFSTFYFLLNKCFNFKDLSSAAGSYFYAFSIIKYAQLYHVQLLSQFYTIIALICFIKSKKYKYLSFIGCAFIALQLYTSFYLGWFIVFTIFFLTAIDLFFEKERNKIFQYLKQNYKFIIFNLLFLVTVLLPLAMHYLMVGITKFPYNAENIIYPSLKNYILNFSLINNLLLFNSENYNPDIVFGFGIITSLLIFIGFFHLKQYRNIIVIFTLLVYAVLCIPLLHKLLYDYFPGAGAIRAVGRFINILYPLFAILLTNLIEKSNKNIIKTTIIILLIAEQIPVHSFFLYSKKDALHDITKYNIPKTCNVIFMNYSKIPKENNLLLDKIEVDGVWLALNHKIYTVNGFPGISIKRIPIKLQPECIIELKD